MEARTPERGQERPLTSLVFPCYNPGQRVVRTWMATREFLRTAPGRWEILFVCDGCTDGTPEHLRELIGSTPGVRVLSYANNRGKGHAVRYGLVEASGAWRLFTDVDLAYGFDEVLKVARVLWGGADVAIASRTHPQSRMLIPVELQSYAHRRSIQSHLFSTLVRLLLPLRVADTQAGLKGFSQRLLDTIQPVLSCSGFGFDCELLTACVNAGIVIQEVPVCVRYEDRATTTGPRKSLQMFLELWRIHRRLRHGQLWVAPLQAQQRPRREAA